MANKHYDEFCEAELPNYFTQLDHQLLGHMCARFNESKTPPKAYPPLTELKRITGVSDKSISRSLSRLIKAGLLFRVTRARIGWQSEYAPNMVRIRELKVTDELPIDNEQVTEKAVIGNPTVLHGSPTSYPKPIKPIKPTTQLFNDLLSVIPNNKHFTATPKFLAMLEQLKPYGTSYNDLKAHLKGLNWFSINLPKEFVISLIKEKLDRPPRYSSEVRPEWCRECDEVTRKATHLSYVPNGNGTQTQSCLKCDPYMVNRSNNYY
jgi:hypothetical protein